MGNWFVYILECRDGKYYVGITNNVDARITAHNAGRGARFTRGRGPVTLRYKERQPDKSHALKREHEIKTWRRAKKASLFRRKRKAIQR
jgi:putative endonuclease